MTLGSGPQNLVHEKGTNTHTTQKQTLQLPDRIGPEGRFDENNNQTKLPQKRKVEKNHNALEGGGAGNKLIKHRN